MNLLEKNMIKILTDLKANYDVTGVKAEFEAEGSRLEEVFRLKDIANNVGLDLTIKIGGCEALRDIYDTKIIGAKSIVAPMIESAYALKKYINAIKSAFSEEELENISLFINIETITGFNNLDSILDSSELKNIDGIVFGRTDFARSIELNREQVNCDQIFTAVNILASKIQSYRKKLIVGGGVSPESLSFFRKLNHENFTNFETRKVIFDANKALNNKNINQGILKALEFELMWLKNKQNFYGKIYNEDIHRFVNIEKHLKAVKI